MAAPGESRITRETMCSLSWISTSSAAPFPGPFTDFTLKTRTPFDFSPPVRGEDSCPHTRARGSRATVAAATMRLMPCLRELARAALGPLEDPVNERLRGAPRGRVRLPGHPHEREALAQLGRQGASVVAADVEVAAPLRAIVSEGGDDEVTPFGDRLPGEPDVAPPVVWVGQEV